MDSGLNFKDRLIHLQGELDSLKPIPYNNYRPRMTIP